MGGGFIYCVWWEGSTNTTRDRGSERKVPHTGTETRTRLLRGGSSEEYWSMGESLNQPSRVKDEGSMVCKLLLYGNKVRNVFLFCMYHMNKHRLTPCQQPR